MNKQTIIPIPASIRWREFRVRYLPFIAMLIVGSAALILWRGMIGAGALVGVGEGIRCNIASPQAGRLTALMVKPYQTVRKGDVMAIIQPYDSRAQLDLLKSELEIARSAGQGTMPEQNAMNYERVRAEYLWQKSELAKARINLEHAEKDLRRNEALIKEKLISTQLYELSLRERDVCRAEAGEIAKGVAEMDLRLQKLQALGDPVANPAPVSDADRLARFSHQLALAQTNWNAIQITAPIDGMISYLNHQTGEFVMDGEPILSMNSMGSERIVGYLRQPYPFDPMVDMPVKVVTRSRQRHQFQSKILQVGAQLENITNELALIQPMTLVDMGLPVVVDVPNGIRLRPGEMVDIHPQLD